MRLTLRTLLAYLDNTLETADAEILRQKITESGFATQLVKKIRQRLADPSLPAPPPEAIGPVHDANVIGEYLDSTLPNEQVSEIERACLELDANLAEAAACHQILTMVLGNKADVPAGLRGRIYQLPDREVERIAASSDRFSSISMDDTPSQNRAQTDQSPSLASQDDLPTIESADPGNPQSSELQGFNSVQPVGISDSGVFDAPTRLRQSDMVNPESGGFSSPSSSNAQLRSKAERDSIYGGSIRPSRITPWLVSLAVVAVLLFAIAQIFRPLLPKNQKTEIADNNIPTDVIVPPSEAPPMLELDPAMPDAIVSPGDRPESLEVLDTAGVTNADTASSSTAEALPLPEQAMIEQDQEAMPMTSDDVVADGRADQELPEEVVNDSEMVASSPTRDAMLATPPTTSEIATGPEPELAPESKPEDAVAIATIDGSDSMIVSLSEQGVWSKLGETGSVTLNTPVICGPKFRGVMQTEFSPRIELVGPTGVRWLTVDDESYGLEVEFGRLLITSKEPDAMLSLKLGDSPMELYFADEETVVAASIQRFRSPGVDPIESPDQLQLMGVLTVQGSVQIKHDGETSEVTTGEQWVKRAEDLPTVSPFGSPPDWISAPANDKKSLDDSARKGLLQLVGADESLDRSLHEATLFRRSEVAALAGQTMLLLGQGDVYFGGDGILSEPKQRQYWPDHFKALVATLDRGPESAELLMKAIAKMDQANARVLYRLLVGYSQKQLADGGDEELVQFLDSESMAVRVLALENLREITGTTLYFRAETDNRVRRTPAIRKWMVRQKKGDIRWPEGSGN
jgi:hypothetical protein